MKKSDIVVGTEYAAANANYRFDNGNADRVRVLRFGPITSGYGYRAKTVTGVVVEILDKETGEVKHTEDLATRDIREDWAGYSARWDEIRTSRRRSANMRLTQQNGRAELLPQIINLLEAAGIESEKGYVYNAAQKQRLFEVIPERFVKDEDGEATANFTGPLATDYDDYVTDGKGFTLSYDDMLKIASVDR